MTANEFAEIARKNMGRQDTTARIERAQLRWGNTVAFEYDVRVVDDGERETIHILPMPIGYERQLGAKEDEETEE